MGAVDAPPAVLDDGDAEAAVEGGRQIVTVAFEWDRKLEDPLRPHSQAAQFRPQRDPGDDRGGTAAQAAADGNVVSDAKFEASQGAAPSIERLLGRADDQVFAIERHLRGALARPADRRLRRFAPLDRQVQVESQRQNIEAGSEVGRRCRHPHRGGFGHYSLNASCRAATASFTRLASMMQVMRTSEVEIISMLIPWSDSVRNMVAATPGCPRMPLPMTDTLARPFCASTVRAPISRAAPWTMRSACRPSADDTVNDMSVTPSWLAVCTMTSAAMSASASGAKMAAAMPGRPGTPTTSSRATCSSCAITRTRFRSSMIASSEQMMVPAPA